MARHKDTNWNLRDGTPDRTGGTTHEFQSIHSALLMDLRDELKKLNAVFACPNFVAIPSRLAAISSDAEQSVRTLRTISRKIPARRKVKR